MLLAPINTGDNAYFLFELRVHLSVERGVKSRVNLLFFCFCFLQSDVFFFMSNFKSCSLHSIKCTFKTYFFKNFLFSKKLILK